MGKELGNSRGGNNDHGNGKEGDTLIREEGDKYRRREEVKITVRISGKFRNHTIKLP